MSLSFLPVYLSGASLILLLPAVCRAQYDDFTPVPDYDMDYNATFDYSFFSNASSEDLDIFSERFNDDIKSSSPPPDDVKSSSPPPDDVKSSTPPPEVGDHSAASLPVSLDFRTLLWTLLILISLNTQQLRHTL